MRGCGRRTRRTDRAHGARVRRDAIDLAWTAPDNDGGSAITGYKIEVSTDGSTGSWTDLEDDTESTNDRLPPLRAASGDTRHYRVSAINAEGTSPASAPDSATTGTAAHHADAGPHPAGRRPVVTHEMTVGTLRRFVWLS